MSDQWETFCDVGYYHMWRLRRKTERGWNDGFHINTKAEAEGLCELLNKLERELTEALSDLEFRRDLFKLQEQQLNDVRAERDRLAEALRELCETLLADKPRDITDLLNKAGDALAAVDGGLL
jgi:DNA repair exonuclease SbcCD ATPase subunit